MTRFAVVQHNPFHSAGDKRKHLNVLLIDYSQTGDRAAGSLMALAIRARRTPIGGFANYDLAKAPK
eukprot:gene794-1107_t